MKTIYFTLLLLFLMGTQTLVAQIPGELRELGISLMGEYGFTDPATLSTTAGISPIRTFTRSSGNTWFAKDFNAKDKMSSSYSYGASLFFTASTQKFNLVTIEGGFKHSKLVYYYEFDTPLYSPQSDAVTHFQDWFYTNQYFANLIYSQHIGPERSLFLYAKLGGTYSELTNRLIPARNKNLYDGITATNTTVIGDGFTNLQISETVNELDRQFGILGGVGVELRFGKKKRQSLFGGVFYRHNLKNLINANYLRTQSVVVESNDDVNYRGNHYGYEFGYKFPIIPAKNGYSRGNNASGNKKGTVTVYLNPNNIVGSRWRLDRGQWKKSGESVSIKEGTYLLEFAKVSGWSPPSTVYMNVDAGNSYSTTATYTKSTTPSPPTTPTKPSTPNPSTPNPKSTNLEKDMKSCFNDKKSDPIYYENDLLVTGGKVEIEIYPPNGEDKDKISLCVDGDIELNNYEVTDEGKKITLDMSSTSEALLIIKAEGVGSDGKTEIEAQVITGSRQGSGTSGQIIALQLQKGDYYYIKVVR